MRKIIHVDMDAFYASIEQRDDPDLRGRPVAVGGISRRGVVAAASYEARRFGVHSAMPTARAMALCPELLVVRPRFQVYRAVSQQIHDVFARWSTAIQPLALDEAYLDVSAADNAVTVAKAIKAEILAETGLTASAGVSFNKFLAKIASSLRKPDGLSIVRPEKAMAFIAGLPIESFHGVGPVTAARLHGLDIHTGADLQAMDETRLVTLIGRMGRYLFQMARAMDDRPVESNQPRRSVSVEETYGENILPAGLVDALAPLVTQLCQRLERSGFTGRTLTLKLRTSDYRTQTRGHTDPGPITDPARIAEIARMLMHRPALPSEPIRLIGIGVGNAVDPDEQRQFQLPLGVQG